MNVGTAHLRVDAPDAGRLLEYAVQKAYRWQDGRDHLMDLGTSHTTDDVWPLAALIVGTGTKTRSSCGQSLEASRSWVASLVAQTGSLPVTHICPMVAGTKVYDPTVLSCRFERGSNVILRL